MLVREYRCHLATEWIACANCSTDHLCTSGPWPKKSSTYQGWQPHWEFGVTNGHVATAFMLHNHNSSANINFHWPPGHRKSRKPSWMNLHCLTKQSPGPASDSLVHCNKWPGPRLCMPWPTCSSHRRMKQTSWPVKDFGEHLKMIFFHRSKLRWSCRLLPYQIHSNLHRLEQLNGRRHFHQPLKTKVLRPEDCDCHLTYQKPLPRIFEDSQVVNTYLHVTPFGHVHKLLQRA